MRTCFLRHPRPVVTECDSCRRYVQDPVYRQAMDDFMLRVMLAEKASSPPCMHDPAIPEECDTCRLYLMDPIYNQMWGGAGVKSMPAPSARMGTQHRFRQVINACMYLGDKLKGQACGSDLHTCNYDGKIIARFETSCSTGKAARSCEKCPHHPLAAETEALQ